MKVLTLRTLLIVGLVIQIALPNSKKNAMSAQTASEQSSRERATVDKDNAEKQAEVLRLKVFHQEIITSLENGKSLDETIPKQTLSKLASNAGFPTRPTSKEPLC